MHLLAAMAVVRDSAVSLSHFDHSCTTLLPLLQSSLPPPSTPSFRTRIAAAMFTARRSTDWACAANATRCLLRPVVAAVLTTQHLCLFRLHWLCWIALAGIRPLFAVLSIRRRSACSRRTLSCTLGGLSLCFVHFGSRQHSLAGHSNRPRTFRQQQRMLQHYQLSLPRIDASPPALPFVRSLRRRFSSCYSSSDQ